MNIGDLFFGVRVDDSGFAADLNVKAAKAGDQAGTVLGQRMTAGIKQSWSGGEIGRGLVQGLGLAGGLGAARLITGAISGIQGAIGDSVKNASDLNETIQKSQVVFGAAADDIRKFGSTAAQSMGMSENAAIGAAASIGNLLLSTGTAREKIAPMSEGIVQLAADLASFNNIPIEDALAKLQSGLVGQERPLRELGVAISAASVDTEAAALGFTKLNGTFTEGQKVQARYSLIFKQTTTAQGDFARTSGGMANQQRQLNAEFENTSAALGEHLIPLTQQAQKVLIDLFATLSEHALQTSAVSTAVANTISNDSLGALNVKKEALRKAIDELHGMLFGLGFGSGEAAKLEADLAKVDAAISVFGTNRGFASAGKAEDDFTKATDTMAGKVTDDLGKIVTVENKVSTSARVATHDATIYWQNYRDAISKVADSLITKAFQPVIDNDALMAKNAEIYAQDLIIAESRKTIASQDSSKAQIKAAQDASAGARTALHQLDMDQATMLKNMAAAGTTTSQAYKDGIAQLKDNIKNSSGPTKTALEAVLKEILILEAAAARLNVKLGPAFKMSGTHPGGGGPQQFGATGGYFPPGTNLTVGEQGWEQMKLLPGGGAFVLPHDQSVAAAGGGGPSGPTYVTTINYPDPSHAPEDFSRTLRRVAALGHG